jgi:AcrR family transcriptional regulator
MKSRAPLSPRSIVSAAIAIADAKGLTAVTLRGIASRLGVHVTSLYNHVPTKEAVLVEMTQALLAETGLPASKLSWQEWVRRFADEMRSLARKHPGAFEAFNYVPAGGERALETLDAALAAFREDGFDVLAAFNAVRSTFVGVLGLVLDDLARLRHPDFASDLNKLPLDRFPHVQEANTAAASADTFDYFIRILIDGLAQHRLSEGTSSRKRRSRAVRSK